MTLEFNTKSQQPQHIIIIEFGSKYLPKSVFFPSFFFGGVLFFRHPVLFLTVFSALYETRQSCSLCTALATQTQITQESLSLLLSLSPHIQRDRRANHHKLEGRRRKKAFLVCASTVSSLHCTLQTPQPSELNAKHLVDTL